MLKGAEGCCRWTTVAWLLVLLSGAAAGQDPEQRPPVFRSGTAVVEVTVIVRDRNGAFVPDLTMAEFEVREADGLREVQTLYLVAPSKPPAAEGRPLEGITTRPAERVLVFLFDMEHLSPGGLTRARDAVVQFTRERLLPADMSVMAALGESLQGRVSSDHAAVADSVKRLKPRGDAVSRQAELRTWPRIVNEAEALQIAARHPEALERARDRACRERDEECLGESLPAQANRAQIEAQLFAKALAFVRESRAAAGRSVAALDQMSRSLDPVPGRKTIVWITEGGFSDEIMEEARQTAYRASRSGVAIYALDPRGLAARTGGGLDAYAVDDSGMDVLMGAAQDAPHLLALGSGGLAIRNENRLDRALRIIEDDTSTYYVLGYASAAGRERSEYRPLHVRVRRPNLSVRARHGYVAPPALALSASVALEGPTGVPVALPVAPLSSTEGLGEELVPGPVPLAGRSDAAEHVQALESLETNEAIRLGPAGSTALAREGWAHYARGDVESAREALAEAVRDEAPAWVFYALGQAEFALQNFRRAADAWNTVRLRVPGFKEVYLDLTDAYLQMSDYAGALRVLRDAATRWPSDAEVHNAIGVIQARRGALDEAIAAFSRAAASAPAESLAHFNLGRAYEMRFARSHRYVATHGRWTFSENDRRKAREHYEQYLQMGGPYEPAAREALRRLEWVR